MIFLHKFINIYKYLNLYIFIKLDIYIKFSLIFIICYCLLFYQETAALHRTRDEFDLRIREMETAVDKQTKKLKNKDKKVGDHSVCHGKSLIDWNKEN